MATTSFAPPPVDPDDPLLRAPGLRSALDALAVELDLGPAVRDQLLAAHVPLCRAIDRRRRDVGRPLIVGVHGAQGSGKTTFCRFAEVLLHHGFGWTVCGFSIDDCYLGAESRRELARTVHPLFATRGVPGTHDVGLGTTLIDRLRDADAASRIPIPSFDKARDDRVPSTDWEAFEGTADIVIFEGWCVGIPPQDDNALEAPLNALEATEDPDGTWRRRVNHHLRTDYADWFDRLDLLIMLEVPGFEQVRRWRGLQEEKLARRHPDAPGLMDAAALDRFLMHYERLTRHALATLPAVADVVCRLDANHRIVRIESRDIGLPTEIDP